MNSECFDVVIVGGGAAGCVLARRAAESGERSVLLLEAGPDVRGRTPPALNEGWGLPRGENWPFDWGYQSEPDAAGDTSPVRRGRVLGGTSWLTRFAVRGAAADFDSWVARGNPGWGYADVLPFFRSVETDAEFSGSEWHGATGPIDITRYPSLPRSDIHAAALDALVASGFAEVGDHNAPAAVGAGPMPMSSRDGRRVTTLDAYLPAGAKVPGLRVRADAPVANVVLERERAVGVRLINGELVESGSIVVAAGTYGSPAILMRSGIGPGADLRRLGIPVIADLPGVGANLADHPGVEIDVGWRDGERPASPVLHSIATFRSTSQPADAPPDLLFWLADPAGSEPAFTFELVLLKPEGRGSVRLRSADPSDPPRITLPSLSEKRDLDRAAEGFRRCLEVANLPSVRRLAAKAVPDLPSGRDGVERILASAYSIPHVVGTCRMGPSAATGDVVDAAGRVHGLEGLRVVDASIMPEPPAGFPHLVTVMIAERLAALMWPA